MKNTLIIAPARSGSTNLYRAINAVQGSFPSDEGMEPFDPAKKQLSRNVQAVTSYTIRRNGVVKHLWNQVSYADNAQIVRSAGVHQLIMLYRRHVFSQALSRLVAKTTRQWEAPSGDQAPFFIFGDTLNTQIQYFIYSTYGIVHMLQGSGVPFIVVAYEDIYDRRYLVRAAELRRIIKFLGIYRPAVDAALDIINPQKKYKNSNYYRRVLLNFNDLYRVYGKYDRYFEAAARRPENMLEDNHADN